MYIRIVKYPKDFHLYEKPEDMKIILSYKTKPCTDPHHTDNTLERVYNLFVIY